MDLFSAQANYESTVPACVCFFFSWYEKLGCKVSSELKKRRVSLPRERVSQTKININSNQAESKHEKPDWNERIAKSVCMEESEKLICTQK